jgi:DNA polymerase-3 subunit delta
MRATLAFSMESQSFFFIGDNAYALQQEVSRWKQSFAAKHGPENLEVLSGATQTVSSLLDAVATMPFIAEKRLVICEGVPKIDKDDVATVLQGIHPQVIFAVVEPKVDKRLGAVKAFMELATVKRFDAPDPAELASWVRQTAASLGASMAPDAVRSLLTVVGDDQWVLSNELKKLCAYADGQVTAEHVELLCVPSGSQVIWQLTDLLGGRKPMQALQFLRRRLDRGEDPYGMWVILLNAMKNIGAIRMCLDAGVTDERSIAKAAGVHFFAIRGLLPLVRSLDSARVRTLVSWAADADCALKTGELKYTAERPGELIALAEQAILACA